MIAVCLKMKIGADNSNNPRDILSIGIKNGNNFKICSVSVLYKFLKDNTKMSIQVNKSDAYLVPAVSLNGEHYIRSEPNSSTIDALMHLPRCKVIEK